MIITRRQFGLSVLGAISAATVRVDAGAAQHQSEFICATIEPVSKFQIDDFSSVPGSRNIAEYARQNFSMTDYGVSFFQDRWLRNDGLTPNTGAITLGIFFLDGSQAQHEAFQSAVKQWLDNRLGQFIRFDFSVPRERSQVRVSFNPSEGNYSRVGRNNLDLSQDKKTMNIADVVDHVMMHEMGHALGLKHEHNHADSGIVWNEPIVYAEMRAVGWSDEMTSSNILKRYTQAANCVGNPAFDRKSVMLYPIPLRWTENGFSSLRNMTISDGDRQCLNGLYSS